MSLSAGTRLGPYVITSAIGAGGMGEVYLARDTKLQRDVAVKILPEAFAEDAGRLARFEREAQVLASLNHPNIAQVHGFEDSGAMRALIMELVDGEDLARRLARGPIPLDESLTIAAQIADALDAAHGQGIVHRDLKPANIKIKEDGTVKVLDFGLAKAVAPASLSPDLMSSPTALASQTEAGVILGTAAYMSPEQARGKAVDKRTDVWAFGAVLYEMLTGRASFARDTASDTVAAVLKEEPDWARVPPQALRLLQWCLEKDPKRRLRDIGDVRLLLEEPGVALPARTRWPWIVGGVCVAALAVAAVVLWLWPRSGADRPLIRLDARLGTDLSPSALGLVAFSQDGSRLVFPSRTADGRQVLATRLLDRPDTTLLEGTDGADQPFFSPDAAWIAFFADGQLKKVSVRGGAPVVLCDVSSPRGASWVEQDTIVAALINTAGLWRVAAEGGARQPLTTLRDGELTHRWPQVLPGNTGVLFTAHSGSLNSYEDASIDVLIPQSGERRTVWRGGYSGRFIPSDGTRGYLVYIQRGVLHAVRFDSRTLQTDGTPVAIVEDVGSDPTSAAGRFAYSSAGVLAYRSGAPQRAWPIVWMDAAGKTERLLDGPARYYSPRFAPDGKRLALAVEAGKGSDIFIRDFHRDTTSPLTFAEQNSADPVWAPGGSHLAFRTLIGGQWHVQWTRADGVGGVLRLLTSQSVVEDLTANAFSPDGRRLIYSTRGSSTSSDLWVLPLDVTDPDRPKPGRPEVFLQTPFSEQRPAFSPDGRWVAYTSNESGTTEVYVRPFSADGPSRAGKWQISTDGGLMPVWSKNGREIFYQRNDYRMMVVDYTSAGASFRPGKPRVWSSRQLLYTGFTNMDVTPDGKRLAVALPPDASESSDAVRVTFLLNFLDELRRRVDSAVARRD
jgi:Tol biopolymer transport system component